MSSHSPIAARSLQRVETRSRILQQATRLCARRGFARTRTIDVARAAGVSHGSVFVHFPSRADLMTAVVAEMAREITDALHALSTAGASVREVLTAHVECLAAREHQIRWLLLETPMLPKGFHSAWLGLQSAVSVHLSGPVEREMASGRIRQMPLHLLFNSWIGLIHHYVINRELFAPGRSVLREHGPMLVDHFMNLLAASPPPRRKEKRR